MFKSFKNGNAFDNGLMIVYILLIAFALFSCQANTYTRQEVEEIRQEYEDELESVRYDSYDEGYSAGYVDGYDDAVDDSSASSSLVSERDSHIVWITPAGSKYHLRSCSAIRGHHVERTTLGEAEVAGYTACSKCNP